MAYMRNDLISRTGYSGMGGWLDTVLSDAGSVLQIYGSTQQAKGAAMQSSQDLQAALAAQQGSSTTTILLIGGLAVGAFLLLRRKKRE
jgi:LPXTG-motif cell wall-anchored protein